MINIQIPKPKYYTLDDKRNFLEEQAERMRNNPTEGEYAFKKFCDKYQISYQQQVPVTIGYKGYILDFVIITKNIFLIL